jgi:hypothetical protein
MSLLYNANKKISHITEQQRNTNLPNPIPILTPTVHRNSNKDCVILPWSSSFPLAPSSPSPPSSGPPLTPRASFGTSNTKLATPSPPGAMIYSGPLNDTVLSVSETSNIGVCELSDVLALWAGRTSVRVKVTVSAVFCIA